MTLPYERTRAVNHTREFLFDLTDPKKTPRLPKYIRQQAYYLLRHYPTPLDMQMVSEREDHEVYFVNQVFGTDKWLK
jgi:hypothetical protein